MVKLTISVHAELGDDTEESEISRYFDGELDWVTAANILLEIQRLKDVLERRALKSGA